MYNIYIYICGNESAPQCSHPRPQWGCRGWLSPTWWVIDSLRSDSVSGWLIPSALSLQWWKTLQPPQNKNCVLYKHPTIIQKSRKAKIWWIWCACLALVYQNLSDKFYGDMSKPIVILPYFGGMNIHFQSNWCSSGYQGFDIAISLPEFGKLHIWWLASKQRRRRRPWRRERWACVGATAPTCRRPGYVQCEFGQISQSFRHWRTAQKCVFSVLLVREISINPGLTLRLH